MIFTGFDGLNMSISMSPREFKVLYHALGCLDTDDHKKIANDMKMAGFAFDGPDVFAVTQQFKLNISDIAQALKKQNPDEEKNALEPEKTEKKSFLQ